jgi:hypothetical protein
MDDRLDENIECLLRAEIAKAGSQSAWAREHGFDRCMLNKVLRGRKPITPNLRNALLIGDLPRTDLGAR